MLADVFVIVDDKQFEKGSFINRNKVYSNNQVSILTIPVKTKGYQNKEIRDIEVSNHFWKRKHLATITQAYGKSANFEQVYELLFSTLQNEFLYLCDYINEINQKLFSYMGISTKIIFASDLNINKEFRKLDYVMELTKKAGGDTFVFGEHGSNYADKSTLSENGIRPYFQEYIHPVYTQRSVKFVPYLSIFDLLFNEPRDKIKEIILSGNISKDELLCRIA